MMSDFPQFHVNALKKILWMKLRREKGGSEHVNLKVFPEVDFYFKMNFISFEPLSHLSPEEVDK